ncbi:bile acid:sodium symporter family protein [Scopulibacillus cellulosilyticus]|uniref:Bile acid:sodium symporter family protein n=1 Tax=Scopulibacillus cellulosilyticus TaxID=2665665 RepID=A0ABW2PX62_9BACL
MLSRDAIPDILTFFISRLLPLWIILLAFIAFFFSRECRIFSHATNPAIGFVLLLMGLTLDKSRLFSLIRHPWESLIGSLGKWMIAPGVSVALAYLFFSHNESLRNGIIMAGIVPSGTSANLNALIAGGDVAYSVTMTAIDTIIGGPLLTPALASVFAGAGIHVEYLPFVLKMMKIVFFPLIFGLILQIVFPVLKRILNKYTSIFSSLALFIVVLGVVSGAQASLESHMTILLSVAVCVTLQVSLQMFFGYGLGRLLNFRSSDCRSLIFETGICNSALAAVLANSYFGSVAGVAAMANMVCNLTMGSLVASLLSKKSYKGQTKENLPIGEP